MVHGMIDNDYEKGKEFLLQYVINFNLHTLPGPIRIDEGHKVLDVMDYNQYEIHFLDKLKLTPFETLTCKSCALMDVEKFNSRLVFEFSAYDDMPDQLNGHFQKYVDENSCHHIPEFPDNINIELRSH